ncbi:MOS1T transposase, partial [Pseudoatta argentina]
MSIFVPNKVYLRGILLHYFIQKKSAAEAHRILVQTYGDNALSDTTCRITGDRYRLQLMRLSRALKEKRPLYAQKHDKVILLHNNARPHVAKPVKTYLETLKWEVLPHPLYSPDIAPSDFHLFRSMAHGLADRRFHSYEEAQKWIDSWIASKDMSFFRRGIHVLPERWEKVVSSDGQYFKLNVCFPYILNTSFYFVKKQRELIQGPILKNFFSHPK